MTVVASAHPRERERLIELHSLGLLDTGAEEAFDRITRLACQIFEVPIALVSLVDDERQWFKSRQGLPASETHRDLAFCAHAILDDGPMVVPDARADDRFAANPLVTDEPAIGFYAGVPLAMPSGLPAGTLCVIDREARSVDTAQLDALEDLAAVVEGLFDLRSSAVVDTQTGLVNRQGFLLAAEALLRLGDRQGRPVTIGYVDIDGLKAVNDRFGHDEGDRLICTVADLIGVTLRDADVAARLGGDEFAVAVFDVDEAQASVVFGRLIDAVATADLRSSRPYEIGLSAGWVSRPPGGEPLIDLLAEADEAMYRHKQRDRARSDVSDRPEPTAVV